MGPETESNLKFRDDVVGNKHTEVQLFSFSLAPFSQGCRGKHWGSGFLSHSFLSFASGLKANISIYTLCVLFLFYSLLPIPLFSNYAQISDLQFIDAVMKILKVEEK